jgi:predicted TIM-barrel fold metal-dependent hydrolase
VDGFPALQGAFRLEEYRVASKGCGIEGTVFMEVDVDTGQNGDEARFFCGLAEDSSNGLLGVIASGRPEEDGFEDYLDSIAHPGLVGLRRVLHTRPDEISQSRTFRENIARLGGRNLTFDLCVLQRQLGLARELVRACPGTTFVLDHCGTPSIAENDAPNGAGFRQWQDGIRALAAEPNLHCKLSGISVYAKAEQRTAAGLLPYCETVLEAFGTERVLWGGDWPVVNLGAGLSEWCRITREMLQSLPAGAQSAILTANARRIYRLGPG